MSFWLFGSSAMPTSEADCRRTFLDSRMFVDLPWVARICQASRARWTGSFSCWGTMADTRPTATNIRPTENSPLHGLLHLSTRVTSQFSHLPKRKIWCTGLTTKRTHWCYVAFPSPSILCTFRIMTISYLLRKASTEGIKHDTFSYIPVQPN